MRGWSDDELARAKRLEAGETVCVSMRHGVHTQLISWAQRRGLFVRIDRKSKWGNPFVLGPDGDRDTVIRRYVLSGGINAGQPHEGSCDLDRVTRGYSGVERHRCCTGYAR
jgi:hypothetical protein